jgi:hypothetical protein
MAQRTHLGRKPSGARPGCPSGDPAAAWLSPAIRLPGVNCKFGGQMPLPPAHPMNASANAGCAWSLTTDHPLEASFMPFHSRCAMLPDPGGPGLRAETLDVTLRLCVVCRPTTVLCPTCEARCCTEKVQQWIASTVSRLWRFSLLPALFPGPAAAARC